MGKGQRKKWKRELHCPVSPQLPARTERLHHYLGAWNRLNITLAAGVIFQPTDLRNMVA